MKKLWPGFLIATFFILALVFNLGHITHHTWTLDTGYPKDNVACSGTTCAVTGLTSTIAHHQGVVGMLFANSGVTISSITAGVCNVSWVRPVSPTTVAISASGKGGLDFMWCPDLVGGQTSVTITSSGTTGTSTGYMFSFASSLGTVAIDTGATASSNSNPGACTTCTGVSLTLSGNNDFCIASAAGSNNITGLAGTGWVNDLSNPINDGIAHLLNNTATSLTAPTSWTHSASGTGIIENAACFQETGGVTAHSAGPVVY